jgi:hypothetical protein
MIFTAEAQRTQSNRKVSLRNLSGLRAFAVKKTSTKSVSIAHKARRQKTL